MKYCPNCQTRYTDDTLRFCLQDGTPLAADSGETPATIAFGNAETDFTPVSGNEIAHTETPLDEAETVVTPRQVEPLSSPPLIVQTPETYSEESQAPEAYVQDLRQNREMHVPPAPPGRSKTLPLVLATAFVTLLLLGAGGVGAWLYLRNNQNEIAANTASNNAANTNPNVKSNVKNSPSPTVTPRSANNANAANVNAASTPLPAIDAEQVKKEVSSRVNSWIDFTESREINDYMNLYAPTVDYYNRKNANAAYIRNDKQRAFNDFESVEMNISNLNVTPDASGERATAVFDKEWVFEGGEKYSAGKVQTQLQLRRINNQWLIVSERDLKVYYTE